MSIGSISQYSNSWQWQTQAAGNTTTPTSGSIDNTGSLAASGNISAFMQTFSADLQSMLAQAGTGASTTATQSVDSTTSANQTATNQPAQTAPHHHHHHGGEGDSMQTAANQMAGEIDQSVQSGTLSTAQIDQSASAFATDVMQALQSYGTATSVPTSSVIV